MLVGVPRFELGTSRTRTVRSTGLSHTPVSIPFGDSVRIIPSSIVLASGLNTEVTKYTKGKVNERLIYSW